MQAEFWCALARKLACLGSARLEDLPFQDARRAHRPQQRVCAFHSTGASRTGFPPLRLAFLATLQIRRFGGTFRRFSDSPRGLTVNDEIAEHSGRLRRGRLSTGDMMRDPPWMRQVAILIPASPVRGFLSQIAAFSLALRRLEWRRWHPVLHVFLGGEDEGDALREWRPHLRDVVSVLVPPSVADGEAFFYGQIDSCIRWAPSDADALVRMDADTLPVDGFEDVLDYIVENDCVAGVIAHARFPAWPGLDSRRAWFRAADGLIGVPLQFEHAYSLAGDYMPGEDPSTPFYVNDGVVFLPRSIFGDLADCYLKLRPRLMDRLPNPYFSGQVALALAIAEMGISSCALPMRYNFPNDDLAGSRFPEELRNVKIFHYLRNHQFVDH